MIQEQIRQQGQQVALNDKIRGSVDVESGDDQVHRAEQLIELRPAELERVSQNVRFEAKKNEVLGHLQAVIVEADFLEEDRSLLVELVEDLQVSSAPSGCEVVGQDPPAHAEPRLREQVQAVAQTHEVVQNLVPVRVAESVHERVRVRRQVRLESQHLEMADEELLELRGQVGRNRVDLRGLFGQRSIQLDRNEHQAFLGILEGDGVDSGLRVEQLSQKVESQRGQGGVEKVGEAWN